MDRVPAPVDPEPWPWEWRALLSGVLMALTDIPVVALLGTPEGARISPRWLALPDGFLVLLPFSLFKIATRKSHSPRASAREGDRSSGLR